MDRRFKVIKVDHSYSSRAARQAVLGCFTTLKGGVAAAEGRLRAWWRGRLDWLREADVVPHLRADASFQFARNCPPVGVETNDRSRSCGRAFFCPYCRARQAKRVYDSLSRGLFASRSAPPSFGSLCLLAMDGRFPLSGDGAAAHFRDCSAEKLFRDQRMTGASYVQPYLDKRALVVQTRVLVISNDGFESLHEAAARLGVGASVSFCGSGDEVTRKALCRCVATLFQFPFAMYDFAEAGAFPPANLSDLFELARGRRLLRWLGPAALRGGSREQST